MSEHQHPTAKETRVSTLQTDAVSARRAGLDDIADVLKLAAYVIASGDDLDRRILGALFLVRFSAALAWHKGMEALASAIGAVDGLPNVPWVSTKGVIDATADLFGRARTTADESGLHARHWRRAAEALGVTMPEDVERDTGAFRSLLQVCTNQANQRQPPTDRATIIFAAALNAPDLTSDRLGRAFDALVRVGALISAGESIGVAPRWRDWIAAYGVQVAALAVVLPAENDLPRWVTYAFKIIDNRVHWTEPGGNGGALLQNQPDTFVFTHGPHRLVLDFAPTSNPADPWRMRCSMPCVTGWHVDEHYDDARPGLVITGADVTVPREATFSMGRRAPDFTIRVIAGRIVVFSGNDWATILHEGPFAATIGIRFSSSDTDLFVRAAPIDVLAGKWSWEVSETADPLVGARPVFGQDRILTGYDIYCADAVVSVEMPAPPKAKRKTRKSARKA